MKHCTIISTLLAWRQTVRWVFMTIVVSLLAIGCHKPERVVSWEGTPFDPATPLAYQLYAGDVLKVRSPADSALDQEVRIRSDGMISLLFAGDVQASGRTPIELTQALNIRLSDKLKTPDVAVIVVKESGRPFYIGGEVKRPGAFLLRPHQTLAQALFEAGGLTASAEPREVFVIRSSPTDGVFVHRSNMQQILMGEQLDVRLQPFDIIYAPSSRIARVGRFVDQYINALIPRVISFPFNTDLNTQRVKVIDNDSGLSLGSVPR